MRLCTSADLSEILGVGRVKLRRLRCLGMPCYRLGSRSFRYHLPDVLAWLEAHPDLLNDSTNIKKGG